MLGLGLADLCSTDLRLQVLMLADPQPRTFPWLPLQNRTVGPQCWQCRSRQRRRLGRHVRTAYVSYCLETNQPALTTDSGAKPLPRPSTTHVLMPSRGTDKGFPSAEPHGHPCKAERPRCRSLIKPGTAERCPSSKHCQEMLLAPVMALSPGATRNLPPVPIDLQFICIGSDDDSTTAASRCHAL